MRIWICFNIAFFTLVSPGCLESEESLFEQDHEIPTHWPSDLEDAAEKILIRISEAKSTSAKGAAFDELQDIVEWLPEIAADTDMSEKNWMDIHQASETLRKHLAAEDLVLSDFDEDLLRLNQLLITAHADLVASGSIFRPEQVETED